VTGPGGTPAQVGQVFSQASPAQYFVLEASGKLATISATLADLLQTNPNAPKATQLTNAMATADLSGAAVPDGGLPATLPQVAPQAATLCVAYGAGLSRSLTSGGTIPAGASPTTGQSGVNAVWLPSGHGALAGAVPSVQQPSSAIAWFLICGAERFALPSPSIAGVLGYDLHASGTVLPASVLDLLPQGPALDPAAATAPATTG
jgi:hypothetical protein